MAEQEYVVVYAATYPTVAAAQAVLDAIEHPRKEVAGTYDAAVVDKENGKAHVVKRMDRPHVRIIPEWFGGGALTRKELDDAAEELLAGEAGLIVIGEATIEPALDEALSGTPKVFKREVAATVDQITSELQEAFKDLQLARPRRSRSSGLAGAEYLGGGTPPGHRPARDAGADHPACLPCQVSVSRRAETSR